MTNKYLRYACKTCGAVSYTNAANAQTTQGGKLLLRCTRGHQHPYGEEEIERLQLEDNHEIRAKMGLG